MPNFSNVRFDLAKEINEEPEEEPEPEETQEESTSSFKFVYPLVDFSVSARPSTA